jgi:cysteine desulfuration protein SufE
VNVVAPESGEPRRADRGGRAADVAPPTGEPARAGHGGCAGDVALASRERPSMASVQDEIIADMADLDGALKKYEYLVHLGRALVVPEASIRKPAHAVPGCQSQVWIRAELQNGRLCILADSEAMIIRGIISLLLRVLDGRTPLEILEGELYFLDRTGLGPHLSPARANGLAAMVRQIRQHAADAAGL